MERMTRQRKAVLQALQSSGRSLHPADIQTLAQAAVPRLNLSTVYRQLKMLLQEGLVQRVDLPGQASRFEITAAYCPTGNVDAAEHHHHFHCLVCEQVFPISGCPGPLEPLAPAGCRVERHDLILHGRCADCAPSHSLP